MYISKINPSGNIVFTKTYGNSFPTKTRLININNITYIATTSNDGAIGFGKSVLTTISTNGNHVYSKSYENYGIQTSTTFIQRSNGNILMFSSFKEPLLHFQIIAWIEIAPLTGTPISFNMTANYTSGSVIFGTNITDVIAIPNTSSPSGNEEYLVSGYYQDNLQGSIKHAYLVAFDDNLNYKWNENYSGIRTINSLMINNSDIYAAGINGNGQSVSIDINVNNTQTTLFKATTLEVNGVSSSLWMSIPYTFDYGANNSPVYSTEAGQLDLFPFFNLNANNNLTNCPLTETNFSSDSLWYFLDTIYIHQVAIDSIPQSSTTGSSDSLSSIDSTLCCPPPTYATTYSCSGSSNGTITAVTDPYCGTYTYDWYINGTLYTGVGSTQTGLSSGVYGLTVTDNNGVVTALSPIVIMDDLISYTTSQTNNVCDSDCNGSASVSASSSFSNVMYLWNTNATTNSITNLCNGNYSVTITNGMGCEEVVNFTISATDVITVGASTQDNICLGSCTGSISVNATSSSTISYLWNTGQTTNQLTNLCDGTYTVTVTNSSGCIKVKSYTISTNPTLNTNWQKNTENPTGQNDVVKKTLTDDQGNLYVMGEFMMETILDGYVINSGGLNNQKGIFVAKYRSCGDLDWVVNLQNLSGSVYDVEGFDIDFNNTQQDIVLFGKWNHSQTNQSYQFVSSGGSVVQSGTISVSKDVFSVNIITNSGSFTTIPLNDYTLNFSDRYTAGKAVGQNNFIGGKLNGYATVSLYNYSVLLNDVIKDQNTGNIIADFEVDGLTDIYAAINLESGPAVLDVNNPIQVSSQGDAIILKAPISTFGLLSPSYINPAFGSDILINDIDINIGAYNAITAVGDFIGTTPGWSTSINSNIKTAIIAQFYVTNLGNIIAYQMDGMIQSASANAVTTQPDLIMVTGEMEGNYGEFNTVSGVIATNTGTGPGTKSMWVAQFIASPAQGAWIIGSTSNSNILSNDIAYHYNSGLFYVGGSYADDISLPPFSNLVFPSPGSGQKLGYIIRGGDQYIPNQGAFFKTTQNDDLAKGSNFEDDYKLLVFPNPSNGDFTLRFQSELKEDVNITIISITGSVVFNQIISKLEAEIGQLIHLDYIASGIYTVQLRQGDLITYKKLIIE